LKENTGDKYMTVQELIEKLQTLPDSLEVYTRREGVEHSHFDVVVGRRQDFPEFGKFIRSSQNRDVVIIE